MRHSLRLVQLVTAAILTLCVSPFTASVAAQQSISIDSVTKQLRSHAKPKKPTAVAAGTTARTSTANSLSASKPIAKTKREVPAIILPVARPAVKPLAAKQTAVAPADSTPAVRRGPKVSKSKPPR
jgi:hypothetical protein